MQRDKADAVVASASGEVASLAAEVHGLVHGIKACADAGSRKGAVQLMLEIEPLTDLQPVAPDRPCLFCQQARPGELVRIVPRHTADNLIAPSPIHSAGPRATYGVAVVQASAPAQLEERHSERRTGRC